MNRPIFFLIGILFLFCGSGFSKDKIVWKEGVEAEKLGDYLTAKTIYQQLHRDASSVNRSNEPILLSLSRISILLTEYDSADFYLSFLRESDWERTDSLEAAILLQEAILRTRRDQYDLALAYLKKINPLETLPDTLTTEIEIAHAWIDVRKNQFEEGEEKLLAILESDQLASITEARVHYSLGFISQKRRKYENAIQYYEKVESILTNNQLAYHPDLATNYNMMAQVYLANREIEMAKSYLKLALDIQKRVLPKDHLDIYSTQMAQGVCSYWVGDYKQAINDYQLALGIALKRLGETHRKVGALYNNIGLVYFREKMPQEALEAFRSSVEIYKPILGENNLLLAQIYNNMGLSLVDAKRIDQALIYYKKAYLIRIELLGKNDLSLVSIYNNMGLAFNNKGQYQEAVFYGKKALNLISEAGFPNHPRAAVHCNNIANAYRDWGKLAEAMEWHQESLKRIDPEFSAETSCDNPSLDRLRLIPEVRDILWHKATTMGVGEEAGNPYDPLCRLNLYRLVSDFVDSMRVSYLAEDSKFKLAEYTRPLYDDAIGLCWELYQKDKNQEYLELAFYFSEKQKSVILLESVGAGSRKNFGGVDEAVLALESDLKHQLAEIRENLFYEKQNKLNADSISLNRYSEQLLAVSFSYDSLMSEIEKQYPEYVKFIYSSEPPSINELAQRTQNQPLGLIEYFQGEKSLYIFYFHDGKAYWMNQEIDSDFQTSVTSFREAICAPFLRLVGEDSLTFFAEEYIKHGVELHRLLIGSIEEVAKPHDRLLIIPDGQIGYLPFGALLTEKPSRIGAYRSYPYLVKKHQISFQYSAALFLEQNPENQASEISQAIAFSPVYTSSENDRLRAGGLADLPYGKLEVEAIGRMLDLDAYMEEEASKQTFLDQSGQADLIHISAHAKVNDENSKRSAIYFGTRDSLLILDLFNLSLQAKLVILSACETGLGKLYQGEGIMSLARGFTYAGAMSIVNSLWQVNDETTAKVMTNLYFQLVDGKSKDEALQLAQLQYLKDSDHLSAHPFYWAGQVAIGDMRALEFGQSDWYKWLLILLVIPLFIVSRRFFHRQNQS